MKFIVPGERVLVTGGTGSLGWALTERLLKSDVVVRIMSRDEKKQYDMKKRYPNCEYFLGDMRDKGAVRDMVRDVDVVIHGASLKYINISELQPYEYVSTNVIGTMNLIDAVLEERSVRRVVGISTDKACLPVNTYGLTKALLEKVMLEANSRQGKRGKTIFNVARYGNVVGTRGSVVPFWGERRRDGLTLPVTNPDMTRFFFTLEEAVDLVDCALMTKELIVSKRMRACTLGELAAVMCGPEGVEVSGERPGEKKHEQLLSADEMSRTYVHKDYFFYNPSAKPGPVDYEEYGSFNAERIPKDELAELVSEWL